MRKSGMNMPQPEKLQRLLLFMMVLAVLSLLPNITTYDFRGEEPRRFLVAYEMAKSGSYLQPTVFGEPYFNKPPLFNWIVVAAAAITGWNVLAVRLPSLVAMLFTALLVFRFSLRLYGDRTQALLSGLVFLTSLDILYWYGWMGEIDATLILLVSLMIFSQFWYLERQRGLYLTAAGFLAGIIFLLKGFVACLFFGVPLMTMAIYRNRFLSLFSPAALVSYGIAVAIPALWALQVPQSGNYLKTLFGESTVRVELSMSIVSYLRRLVEYPFLNIKQTLPASLFLLYAVFIGKARLQGASRMLAAAVLFSYVPFLLAPGSRGRYILPLLPPAAVLASRLILDAPATKERFLKAFLSAAVLFIIGRFLFGAFWFPYDQERRGSPKMTARQIMEIIDLSRPAACDCAGQWTVCLYLDVYSDRVLKSPSVTGDWEYLVTCSDSAEGEVIGTFRMHKAVASVRKRN